MPVSHSLSFTRTASITLIAATLFTGLSGCDSSDNVATTTLNGSVFAAAVSGASCEIQDNSGTTVAGPVSTSTTGTYSISIPSANLANDLMLVCSGGSYTDEADGSTQTAGTMTAYAAANTLGSTIGLHATPESTIIQQLIRQHGMTLTEAQATFDTNFGYTPDTTVAPTDATNPDGAADDAQLLAGLRAAAFSQMTSDIGLLPGQQFILLSALAQDLSDGALDGVDASGTVNIDGDTTKPMPADIQNQFNISMLNFHTGTRNQTGLSNDSIGSLPFATVTLTDSYKVEYIAGMMNAMQGKTQFKIRLSDVNGLAVSGESVTLMPMMYMATRTHATPVDGACIESTTAGTYDCTVYYLMPSAMMDMGMLMPMGYWDLKVMIGGMMGEVAHFYPNVMMAMNGTARATLKNSADQIYNMKLDANETRTHFLFKSSLSSNMDGSHNFQIFTAAKVSMMSFPAVTSTSTLGSGSDMTADLTITSMEVQFSTDKSTWTTATEDGNGYWSADISGLTNDVEGKIYVKLTINGNLYNNSIDGVAGTEINDFATFTVTPKAMM